MYATGLCEINASHRNELTLKWLGRVSLLNAWLSILILLYALKSSGISMTGIEMCDSSLTV